jgi:hypothetical protein
MIQPTRQTIRPDAAISFIGLLLTPISAFAHMPTIAIAFYAGVPLTILCFALSAAFTEAFAPKRIFTSLTWLGLCVVWILTYLAICIGVTYFDFKAADSWTFYLTFAALPLFLMLGYLSWRAWVVLSQ